MIYTMANMTFYNSTCNFTVGNTICNESYNNVSWLNSTLQPTNPNTRPTGCFFSEITKITLYIFFVLVLVIGIFGNSVVLYVIGYRKKRHTTSDIFIISLAFSDILSAAFYPIWFLSDVVTGCKYWLFGPVMCYISLVIAPVSLPASAWSLVFIAFDRYRIIATPFSPRQSLWSTSPKVVFIWLISFAICVPHMLLYEVYGKTCKARLNAIITPKIYFATTVIWYLFISIIPTLIIGVVYWLTGRALKRNTAEHANNQAMLRRNKENAKILKMFLIIIIIFTVLTMPSSTTHVTITTLGYFEVRYNHSDDVTYIILMIMASNSCVNPFIYAKMQKEIRHFFRALVGSVVRLSTMSANRSRGSVARPTATSLLEVGVQARSENVYRANSPHNNDDNASVSTSPTIGRPQAPSQ